MSVISVVVGAIGPYPTDLRNLYKCWIYIEDRMCQRDNFIRHTSNIKIGT